MSDEHPPTEKINKSGSRPKRYQKQISENVKWEVAKYRLEFRTSSTIKNFSMKLANYCFIRTSINNWENEFKGSSDDVLLRKRYVNQIFLIDDHLVRKFRYMAIGTR